MATEGMLQEAKEQGFQKTIAVFQEEEDKISTQEKGFCRNFPLVQNCSSQKKKRPRRQRYWNKGNQSNL